MYHPGYGKSKFRWLFFIIIPAIIFLTAWLVMIIWNYVMPEVFHIGEVNYWQALGILVLSRILLGGFRFLSRPWQRPHYAAKWKEKWMSMTEEEKEKFREEWKKRCQ
jgi:hypothetical protein